MDEKEYAEPEDYLPCEEDYDIQIAASIRGLIDLLVAKGVIDEDDYHKYRIANIAFFDQLFTKNDDEKE